MGPCASKTETVRTGPLEVIHLNLQKLEETPRIAKTSARSSTRSSMRTLSTRDIKGFKKSDSIT